MDADKLGAWAPLLNQDTLAPLLARTQAARKTAEIYPPAGRELFALTQTPPERVRAVILGQDPYHEPGQAMGLAFSVVPGTVFPPSLRNIFRELTDDVGVPAPASGDLTAWAQRGVLLLNAPHPSPLSSYRGFFGSRPFSKINAFLRENGESEIDWSL